jgi:hypothetical protein
MRRSSQRHGADLQAAAGCAGQAFGECPGRVEGRGVSIRIIHEAIEMVETTDAPDHQVLEELQRGYKFKDRLLRPAMVKVAKNPGK